MSYKEIAPDISEIKTGTPAIKIGDTYFVGGIGGDFIPAVQKESVTLGQVNAEGKFQPLAFDGTEASNSGSPEVVEVYYGFKGVLPVPDSGSGGGSSVCDFYRCASVDTVNKTWGGYKVVSENGIYLFDVSLTTGLSYDSAYTPEQGGVYSADAKIQITRLWTDGLVFKSPLSDGTEVAKTGQMMTVVTGDPVYTIVDGIPCLKVSGDTVLKYTPDECPTGNSQRSVAVWVRTDNLEQESYIASYGSRSNQNYYFGLNCFSGGVRIAASGDSNPIIVPLEVNVWAHITAVYNGETLKMYKNGELYGEASFPASTLRTENNSIQIGGTYDSDYMFDGYVAGYYIYSRELTNKEIAMLANEYTPVKN